LNTKFSSKTKEQRLDELAELGSLRQFRRGTILIQEGDLGGSLYVIVKGRLRAFSNSINGSDREITFGVYTAGDVVGEMALDGGTRSASVIAIQTTICSIVKRDAVRAYISKEPEFAFDLLSKVIDRARRATRASRNLVLIDAYGRLSELFSELVCFNPLTGTHEIPERLTQADIASRIGTSREMVTRLLRDLEQGEYIKFTEKKHIQLLKSLPDRW
jgi:CRP/FNR family transcriptional regulator, cyclic AMP receptor protein